MSDGSDFDDFLDAAREDARASASTTEDARRVEASLSAYVSLRRPLPAAVNDALGTAIASASAADAQGARAVTKKGLAASTSWLKPSAFVVAVLGLSLASYSVATIPSSTPEAAPAPGVASQTRAAPAATAAFELPPSSAPSVTPRSSLASPVDLPAAKSLAEAKEPAQPKGPLTPPPRAARPTGHEDTLDAELALLSRVTSALHEGRAARALELVDEHDRRFPNGALMPEFASQRVFALASLRRHTEACREATTFLAKYPKSPFSSQVRSACVDPNSSR